jgi:hypothetical protein
MFNDYMPDVDKLLGEIKSKIVKDIEAVNKETIERLTKENNDLRKMNDVLNKAANRAANADSNYSLFNFLMNRVKSKIKSCTDKEELDLMIYSFLDCFFEKDFKENTREVPLWLGCATQYYSNRTEVFAVLRALDIALPEGIENFRLPQDWTEEELDEFFAHMENHVNCNNCVFEDNLRFWKPNALDDPIKVCSQHFTEIPWQFLLRNPLLKKEKYLAEIGRMFYVPKGKYHAYQWYRFANITKYQELTMEEIKIILSNIDYDYFNKAKDGDLNKFLLKNIEFIDNEVFLDSLYESFYDSYTFRYENVILKMPYKYAKYYMRDTKNLEWLQKNKDRFTKEQLTELTLAALGVVEEVESTD